MRSAFFMRVFTTFSAIVLALFVAAFFLATRAVRTQYLAIVERGLADVGAIACHATLPLLTNAAHAQLQPYIQHVGALTQTRISIIAPDGTVLADSQADPARMDNHAVRPEVAQALRGVRGTARRLSETSREPLLYLAVPLDDHGRLLAVVRVSTSVGAFETFLADLRGRLALSALVMVALALLVMYLVWRRWAQPIELLARAARAVAAGDLTTKVYIDARDETATLGRCFNEMVARLKQNHATLARQKDELNTILANLSEGLLVLRQDGVVTLCNASFDALTGVSVTRGAAYWEAIRTPDLMEQIERVLADHRHSQRSVELNGRHVLCSADYAIGSDHAVITLHDISDIMAMARMKREFVTNVSHELRTPLASIKGFAETLQETVSADERHYVDIILRNTERLINIVADLLHLSQLERDGFTLECDRAVLNEIIDNVARTFMKRAADKGLQLVLDLPAAPLTLSADAFRLEQVFVNLLDNAIKYTDHGHVRIAAHAEDAHIIITVADTGAGIPAKDLPRVFERFYVVDKSRARAMGGTGLGLAIAKHIVQLHRGTIDVTSQPGQGTTFTISLPRATTTAV
jgi:two-component system phosphate regulon sensor histidine kinase PhoR